MVKLNIGGAKRRNIFPADWIIVDRANGSLASVDIMKDRLPFDTESVDAIYTSHTLEHLYANTQEFVLSEMHRVLKEGSPVRIVVPDIDIAIRAYYEGRHKVLSSISKHVAYKQAELPDFPLYRLSSWFFTYKTNKRGQKTEFGGCSKNEDRLPGGHVMSFNFEIMKHYMSMAKFKNITKRRFSDGHPIFLGCDFESYKDGSLYVEAVK